MRSSNPSNPGGFEKIAALLRRWCEYEELSYFEEQELIESAVRFVLNDYLTRKRLAAAAQASGVSVDQAARSYLGGMFGRDPNWLAINLADCLEKDDAGLVADLKAICIQDTRQELFKRWKELDPLAFRVWTNMKLALHGSETIKLWPKPKPRWAALRSQTDLRCDRPEITVTETTSLLISISPRLGDLPAMINQFLGELASDQRWRAAVRIEEVLFEALCEVARRGILAEELSRFESPTPSPELKLALQHAYDAALKKAGSIIATYLSDGKLSKEGVKWLELAISDLLSDYRATMIWQGDYFGYSRRHCPDITEDEFKRKYKARFDHVALTAHRTFDGTLMEEMGL